MERFIRLIIVLFILFIGCSCYGLDLETTLDATCKIQGGPELASTGFVYKKTEKDIYIITAGHEFPPAGHTVFVTFFHTGIASQPLKGEVVLQAWDMKMSMEDVGMIVLPKKELEKYPEPKCTKFATELPKPGDKLITVGLPEGKWVVLTPCVARETYRDSDRIRVSSGFIPGESGGPIFNLKGEVVGMALWKTGVGSSFIKIKELIGE